MYENILKLAELQDGGELSPTTEEAIALAYADRHRPELRYVAAWSRWLSHDGARWNVDDTLHAFDRARDICREVALECEKSGKQARLHRQRPLLPSYDSHRRTGGWRQQSPNGTATHCSSIRERRQPQPTICALASGGPLTRSTTSPKKPLVTWRRRARRIRYGGRSSFASPAGIPSCSNSFSATSAIVAPTYHRTYVCFRLRHWR